jgi:preprotein translocase subunit SecB
VTAGIEVLTQRGHLGGSNLERPKEWDLVAAGRIASRVEFREIRLIELKASSPVKTLGMLEPKIDHHCSLKKHEGEALEVLCSYQLRVTSGEDELLKADLDYLICYSLLGEEPVDADDLDHFAFTNGTYHSWPFVRQLVFDLTARMGYPPYNLPVFKFFPKRAKPVETPPVVIQESEAAVGSEQTTETMA